MLKKVFASLFVILLGIFARYAFESDEKSYQVLQNVSEDTVAYEDAASDADDDESVEFTDERLNEKTEGAEKTADNIEDDTSDLELNVEDKIVFDSITSVFRQSVKKTPSFNELAELLYSEGYTPSREKQGHSETGFRQVLSLGENTDSSLLKTFYSSYLEEDNELHFDRLYMGFEQREGLFDELVKQLDSELEGSFTRRGVRGNYARWDYGDGQFVFINTDHDFNGEKILLMGQEYEIH